MLTVPECVKGLTCQEVMSRYFRSLDFETRIQLSAFSCRPIEDVWKDLSAAARCEVNARTVLTQTNKMDAMK